MNNRIGFIDGLRGIAIWLVYLYHLYVRWPDISPVGYRYSEVYILKFGWLGVELFFLVSGFVILMTLEKCQSPIEFLRRRWLRLFPGMAICSLFVFSTSHFFEERPLGQPNWVDLIPGLTFVDPAWWTILLRSPVSSLEGAFWSLFVECKFYICAAVLYYTSGRLWLLIGLSLVFSISLGSHYLGSALPPAYGKFFQVASSLFSGQHFGWFISGAAFYVYFTERRKRWFIFAFLFGSASAFSLTPFEIPKLVAAFIALLLFVAPIISLRFRIAMGSKPLLLAGFVSYPFYLLHENLSVALVLKLSSAFPTISSSALPIIAFAPVFVIAFAIARFLEPLLKSSIEGVLCFRIRTSAFHSSRNG